MRTVRLLPQAVKIGILESEIRQDGEKPPEQKAGRPEKPAPHEPKPSPKVQVTVSEKTSREIDELTASVRQLTASLSTAEVRNVELQDEIARVQGEIASVKKDYEQRRKTLEGEAKAAAKKIADEAREKAIAEGTKKGYEEGMAKAREEVEREYLDKFAALAGVIENLGKKLEEDFAELVSLNEPRMIRVWTEMLRRMLFRQVELNPDTIDTVLSELLSRLSDKNQILIYVSPDDMKHLEGELDAKFREALRGTKRLELKADPNIEPGSCIVETGLGIYDARWRTQMGQVEAVVDEIFQQVRKEDHQ